MRIQFLDALRGIAAIAVVLHHYNERLDWKLFSFGNLGVPVFFVLSGYVIAMSIGDMRISASYLGRFALRRALRLDPPYWLTIAAVVAVGYLLRGHVAFDGVTVGQVVAHMFYLQDILSFNPILPIFWTLCYEIQFYLALILLIWATQAVKVPRHFPVLLLLVVSLADRHAEFTHHAFMGRFWSCFALGVLVFWAASRRMAYAPLLVAIASVATYGVWQRDGYALASSASAAMIAVALAVQRPDWLSGPIWQFLGKISYSLYLTHLLFGWLVLKVMDLVFPPLVSLLIGIGFAVATAWAFYHIAEKPAVKLSRRVRVRE